MWSALFFALAACGNVDDNHMRQLWEALAARAQQVGDYLPYRVESRTEVRDGSGATRGTVNEVLVLKKGGEARAEYDVVQREETGDPDISVKLRITARATPFLAVSEGRVRLQRMLPETVAGRCLLRYEFVEVREDKPGAKPVTLEGVAWLDEATGAPWQVVYRIPKPSSPLKQWELTLLFPSQAGESPLPQDVKLEMKGQRLFWKREVIVTQRLEQWRKAP